MQRCEVCGDDDLEFINGEITCRMCGTQCATQQTEVVLDQTTQLRYLTQIAGVSQTQMDTTVREAASRPLPWKLSEAFQLIFFAQVRAVQAKLSLPKDYYKMAIQIWMLYLKVGPLMCLWKHDAFFFISFPSLFCYFLIFLKILPP